MADGSNRYIAYAKESTVGTAPTGEYKKLRTTGGSGIANERSNVTSEEIRSDRQIITSRLGQNQPNAEVPFEFSYESFDEILEGALGGSWSADYELTETVSFGDGDNIITVDDDSDWEEKGLSAEDYIVVRGSDSNDGVYVVQGFSDSTTDGTLDQLEVYQADGVTPAVLTLEASVEVGIEGATYGGSIDTSDNSLDVVASAFTITASTAVFEDIKQGDAVYFTGFTKTENNGYKVVTDATDTVLTFENDTFVDELIDTGNVDFASHVSLLTVGLDLPTFTLEEGFEDVTEYHYTTGCKIASYNMSIQPDAVITGSASFQGQTYNEFSGTPVGTPVEMNTNQVFDSYTGSLYFGGEMPCVITGVDFTLDNGLNRRYALLQKDACSIGEGRSNVTGSINAFFPDSTLADKFNSETLFDARVRLEDLNGNSYMFGFPKLKFTSDSRDISENDVTESFEFQALGGDATLTNMYVRKQPNKPE